MAEEEQKISMQDASDKAGDEADKGEDAYAGMTSEDPPKETQRSGGMLRKFFSVSHF